MKLCFLFLQVCTIINIKVFEGQLPLKCVTDRLLNIAGKSLSIIKLLLNHHGKRKSFPLLKGREQMPKIESDKQMETGEE